MITALRRKADTLRGVRDRHGTWRALYHAATVGLWAVRAGRGGLLVVRAVTPADAGSGAGGEGRLAKRHELLAHARTGTSAITARFVEERLALGDRCVFVERGGAIVAYQWFATAPLRLFGVLWRPAEHYLLFHRAWTAPGFRGQRISERLLRDGLALLYEPSLRGLVAMVEVANFASRVMLSRMDYAMTGYVVQIGPDAWHTAVGRLGNSPLVQVPSPPR